MKLPIIVSKREAERLRQQNRAAALQRRDDRRGSVPSAQKAAPSQPGAQKSAHASPDTSSVFESASASASLSRSRAERDDEDNRSSVSLRRSRSYRRRTSEQREGSGRSSSSSDDDDDNSTSSSRTGSSMRSSPSTSSTSIASAGSSVHGQRNRTAHALPARRPAGVTGAAARPSGTAAGTAAAGAARTQYSTYARKMLNKSRAEEQRKTLSRRSSAVNFDAADAFFDRSDSSVGLDSRASSTLAKDGTPRLRQDDRSDDEEGDEDGGVAREAAHDSVHTQHNGRHGVAENNDEDGGGGRLQQPYRSGTTTGRHISQEEAMRRRVVHDMLEAALIAKQGKGSAPGGGESGGGITAPDTARPRAAAGEQRLHSGPRRGSAADMTPNTKNKAVVALSATSTTPASSSPADSVTERKAGSSGNSGGGGLLGWSRRLRNSARKSTSRSRNDAASAGQGRQRGSAASAGTSPVAASKTSARSPSSSSSSSVNTTSRSAVTQQQQQQYSASSSSARQPSSSSSTAATPVQGLATPNAPPNAANTTTSTTATVAVPAPPPPPPLAHVARHDQSFSKDVLRSMDNAQLSMLAFNAQKARKSSSRHLRRQTSFSSHDGVVARAESTLSLASDGGYGSFVRMPPASPDESLSGRHRSRHSKDNDDDDDDDARSSGSRRGDRHHLYRSSSGRRHSSPTQPTRKMSFFSSLFRSNSNVSTASQRSGRSASSRSSRRKTRTAHSRSHAAQREVSGGRSTAHSSHRPRAATTSAAVTSVAPAAAAKERHSSHRTLSRRGSASFLDIHDGDYGHGGYGTSLYRTFSSSSIGSQSSRNSRRRDVHYEKKSRSGGSHHTSKRATAAATHQGDEQRRREAERKKTGKDDDERLLLQHSQDKDGPYRLRPRRHMSSSSNSITKNNYLNSIEMAGGLGGISSAGSTLHLAHSFGSLFEAAATLGANASGSLYGSSAMSTGIVTASGTASTSSSSSSSSVAAGSVMPMPNSEYGSTAAFGHYASHMAGGDGGGGAAASAGPQGMAAVSSQYSAAMGPRGVSPQPSLPSSSTVGAADAFPSHSYPRAASAAHATGGLGSTGHRGPVHPPHLQQNLVSRLDRPAGAGGSPAYHGRSPHTAGPQTAANKTQTPSRGAEALDGDEAGMQRMPKVNSIGSRPAAAATDGSGEAAAREAELDSATPATHVRSSAPSSERPAGQDGSRSDAASYTHKDNTHKSSSSSSHRHRSNGADDDDNRDAGSVASRRIVVPGGQSHSAADHSSASSSSSSSSDNISSKSSTKKDNKTAQVEEGDGMETPRNIRQRNSLLSLTEGFRIRRRGSATKAAASRRDARQATQAAERRASSNSSSSSSSSSSGGSEKGEPRRRAQPPPGKPSGSDPRRSGSSRHIKASVDASAEGSQRVAKRVHSGNSSLLPQPPTLSSSESKNFRTRIANGSAGNLGKNASFVNGTGHSFHGSGAPPLPPQQQAENGGAPPPTRADSRDFLLRSPPEGSNDNKSSRHPNSNHSSRSRRTQQNNAAPATAASSSSSGKRGTQQTNSAAAAATSGSQGSPHESRRRRSRSRSRSAASSSKNDTSLEFSSDSFLDGRARGRLAKAAAAAAAASASAGNNAATSGSGERRRRGHGSFSHPTDGSGGAAAAAVPHSSSMRRHRGQHLSREQSMVSSRASSASGRAQSDNGGAKATDEQNRRHRRHRHGGETARSPDVDLLESLGSQRLRRSRGDIRYGSGRRHHNSSSASMVAGLDEVLPPRHAVVPPSAPSSAGPSSRNSSNSSGERMGNHVGRNSVRCLRKMAAKARDASNTSSCESELRTNAATSVAGGCSNSQINNSSAKHSHSAMVPQIADGSGGVLGRGSAASTSPAIAFFGAAPMNGSGATAASNAMGGGYTMRLPSFKPNAVAESSSSNDVSSDRAANSGGHRQPYPQQQQQQQQQPPSNGDGASVHFHLMPQLMSHDGSPLPYQGSGNYLLQPARRPGSSGNSRLQISVSNGNNSNSNNNNSNSNTISATTTQERGHEPAGHDTFKYLAPGGANVPAGGQRGFVIERTGSTGSQVQSDASGSGFHDGSGGGSGSVGAHTPAFSPLLTQSRDNSAKRRRPTTASFTPWSVDMSRFDKLREAQTESTPTA